MNVILVMSDSFRYDHVGANGNDWIRTPSLDRFAREHAMVFDNAYCGSFPTIPNRTDIHTGYWTSLRRGWTPLPSDDMTIARHLRANGYRAMHIWDTPHLGVAQFYHGFDGWRWIRGQEGDGYEANGLDIPPFDADKCKTDL
ncbi:MAG: sulfatase-like hydrolase/transferase, partial [Chitinivibrionales bacterium]|nr:sulfatase-like hydrolase/transferase [Chitinivibrionales bacterium]